MIKFSRVSKKQGIGGKQMNRLEENELIKKANEILEATVSKHNISYSRNTKTTSKNPR